LNLDFVWVIFNQAHVEETAMSYPGKVSKIITIFQKLTP
jgi:hypothetical protein